MSLHLGPFGNSPEESQGLESTENLLPACLAAHAGCQLGPAGASDQNTCMWPFHVAAWLPPSIEAGHRELVSQENQAELLQLYDVSCKSSSATLVTVMSVFRSKSREHGLTL